MKSKNSAISVKDVTKIYRLYEKPIDRLKEAMSITHKNFHRDFYALNGISFDVNKGETVGIIGTNGSGKSTILKIITGVLTPTTGEVEVDGVISALLELGAGFNMDYAPAWLTPLLKINPFYYIVAGYRDSMLTGDGFWMRPTLGIYFWAVTIILMLLGLKVFKKLRPHFSDVL